MVDFSKENPSKSFHNTYVEKYDRIIECVNLQKKEFLTYYEECKSICKEISTIIDDLVQLLKSLDINPRQPLGKYDNNGLVEELTRLVKENPDKNMEHIELAIIEIKERYCALADIARKMKTYAQRIDNYPDEGYEANMEADYRDEVVIDISAIKNKNNPDKYQNDDELEKVTDIHPASEETIKSLSETLDNYFGTNKEVAFKGTSDDELDYESILMGTDEEYSEEELEIPLKKHQEEVDYASFTITNDLSFCDLIKYVYDEDNSLDYDSELWKNVYNFSSNKDIIDTIAENRGLTVEEVVSTPGILKNVTLRFPTELAIYEQVSEGKSRAA